MLVEIKLRSILLRVIFICGLHIECGVNEFMTDKKHYFCGVNEFMTDNKHY